MCRIGSTVSLRVGRPLMLLCVCAELYVAAVVVGIEGAFDNL